MASYWSKLIYAKVKEDSRLLNWVSIPTGYQIEPINYLFNLTSESGSSTKVSTSSMNTLIKSIAETKYYDACVVPITFVGVVSSFCGEKKGNPISFIRKNLMRFYITQEIEKWK